MKQNTGKIFLHAVFPAGIEPGPTARQVVFRTTEPYDTSAL